MKVNGTVYRYKSRGLDLFDTYSPLTRITFIWMLILLVVVYDLKVHQMNVKTTLLNGELEEEIYMEQLEGFVVLRNKRKCASLLSHTID